MPMDDLTETIAHILGLAEIFFAIATRFGSRLTVFTKTELLPVNPFIV
jgi:hypothetical protein